MKTHFFLMSMVALLGTTVLTTSYAANTSEYLHFTRHRDSQGNLLMAPTQPQSETSVMQKTMMPSQPKTLERRSTDWGMSSQDVKANEPVQPSWELHPPMLAENEQRVAYHTQIEGIEAALTYTFYEDHLGQAKYVFEPQHDDAVEYVQDFHTVKDWISRSYGSPTSVQDIWLDTLYQYDQSLWGQAVLRGHLVMVAEWKQSGTDIVLMLDGGDDMIGLVADFASTTFVVPVSFASGSAEESIEEVMGETTIQEALPAEPMDDLSREDIPVQETLIDQTGIEGHNSDTEVASQTMTELDEIEKMLNEAFPEMEPLEPVPIAPSMDKEAQELNLDPPSSNFMQVIPSSEYPPMEIHQVSEEAQRDIMEDHLIEPSIEGQAPNLDPQASINSMDEMAPDSMNHQSLEQELAHVEGVMEEHPITPAMEEEGQSLNLDTQASIDMDEMVPHSMDVLEQEPTQVEEVMEDHPIEPENYPQTSEHSNSNSPEEAAEGLESMTSEDTMNSASADAHLMEDHANDHPMESEAELEGRHL